MYAEFRQISFLCMSNSERFLVEEDDDDDEEPGIEFDIVKRPALEFQEERNDNQATANNSSYGTPTDEEGEVVEENEETKGGEYQCDVTASKDSEEAKKEKKKRPCLLGEFKATDYYDDDEEADGFKTPTSLDHKIPMMKQCPPAPRKPKPCFPSSSNKRKASASGTTRRSLQLDLSQEVESLFPKPLFADLHRKIKKARTEDNKQ